MLRHGYAVNFVLPTFLGTKYHDGGVFSARQTRIRCGNYHGDSANFTVFISGCFRCSVSWWSCIPLDGTFYILLILMLRIHDWQCYKSNIMYIIKYVNIILVLLPASRVFWVSVMCVAFIVISDILFLGHIHSCIHVSSFAREYQTLKKVLRPTRTEEYWVNEV